MGAVCFYPARCVHSTCGLICRCLQAAAEPAAATQLRVTIHRVEGLPPPPGAAAGALAAAALPIRRPYAHYRVPGHASAHDTALGEGLDPVWEDCACWGLMRSAELERDLATRTMEVGRRAGG